jgi:tetratricopeptide (TPR) repeat protein
MKKVFITGVLILICIIYAISQSLPKLRSTGEMASVIQVTPTPSHSILPPRKILNNEYQIFQTFNNCGPASLSMALSYYGINVSQKELGDELRPYQNPQGDNDDKSVTLDELAKKAESYGFITYHRPHGSIELIKQFINQDIPVLAITLLKNDDDIGHYRVIKGYDDTAEELIQDDSMQGKNIHYTYSDFNQLWSTFNNEYLVIIPKNKQTLATQIIGEDTDSKIAWKKALEEAEQRVQQNPKDLNARFTRSIASYYLGDYQKSVDAYEEIADILPKRTLWYQIEPIQAYAQLGNTDKVFTLTDEIISQGNRAFSELYLIRGDLYMKQGKRDLANEEYRLAKVYNKNLSRL